MNFDIFLSRKQMRAVEEDAVKSGLSYSRLMENAGSAAARIIRTHYKVFARNVVIICGNGNNGGDGFVIARKLHDEGANVTVILAASYPKTHDSTEKFEQIKHFEIEIINYETSPLEAIEQLKPAHLIIDSVYGIGFRSPLPEAILPLFKQVNKLAAEVVAIDVPSGIDSDSGVADPDTINANLTVTFTALKQGFINMNSEHRSQICGIIEVANIGIDEDIIYKNSDLGIPLTSDMIKPLFPPRKLDSNKGDFGTLFSICGSLGMTGAAAMAIKAAQRSGVGLVSAAIPRTLYPILASSIWEAIYQIYDEVKEGEISLEAREMLLEKAQSSSAVLIGCGFGVNDSKIKLVSSLIRNRTKPTVLDADGLNCAAAYFKSYENSSVEGINVLKGHINILETECDTPLIITPHPGEMARLTGLSVKEIQENRIGVAREFVEKHKLILVLKGHNTVIAAPGKPILINRTGSPGMATAGSGDVLAGIIASFVAQGMDAHDAACAGVFLHGLAGEKAAEKVSEHSLQPSDIIKELSALFLILEK